MVLVQISDYTQSSACVALRTGHMQPGERPPDVGLAVLSHVWVK